MKNKIYYLIAALFILSFSACDNNDTEGVYYNAANTEAVFAEESGSYFYSPTDLGEFNVTVVRGNAKGAAEVEVVMNDESGFFNTPSTVNFEDGSYEATITVSFNKESLEIGKNYTIGLKLPKNPISGKVTDYVLTVTRDYTWEFFTNATMDSQMMGGKWDFVIERAKENQTYYKLKDLYVEGYDVKILINEDGSISMPGGPGSNGMYSVTTGYKHPSYGMIYTYLDPSPDYSYFVQEENLLVLHQFYYVGAGSFGWDYDVITW